MFLNICRKTPMHECPFYKQAPNLSLSLFKKKLPRWCFLDIHLKFLTMTFLILNKLWKNTVIKNVDQIFIANLITQVLTLTSPRFLLLYIKSYQSKKIINKAKILTQISATWYSWQTWLITMHCSQKKFHFLRVSNGPTSILLNISVTLRKSHGTILSGISEKSHSCARYFSDISEMSQKRYLFRDMFKTS